MTRRLTVCLVLCMMALAPCGARAELAHDETYRKNEKAFYATDIEVATEMNSVMAKCRLDLDQYIDEHPRLDVYEIIWGENQSLYASIGVSCWPTKTYRRRCRLQRLRLQVDLGQKRSHSKAVGGGGQRCSMVGPVYQRNSIQWTRSRLCALREAKMSISIGAAILILGLLFLATSKAGLKVLGVVALAGVVGVGAAFYLDQQNQTARAAAQAEWQAHLPELRAKCEKLWPLDPSEDMYSARNGRILGYRAYCERHPG